MTWLPLSRLLLVCLPALLVTVMSEEIQSDGEATDRILGGEPTGEIIKEYLCTLFLAMVTNDMTRSHHVVLYKFLGGAVLVTKDYVLTSAKLVYSKNPSEIMVSMGGFNLTDEKSGMMVSVIDIVVHPSFAYTVIQKANDLAMLKIDELESAQPVPMANDWSKISHDNCIISGHGYTLDGNENKINSKLSMISQSARVTLIEKDDCPFLLIGNLCGKRTNGTKTQGPACSGDTGFPVVCASRDEGPLQLAGIISDPSCNVQRRIDFYTSSIFHYEWISGVTRGEKQPDYENMEW